MNEFFKKLADQLKDRQEFKLNVKKIGADLIMMVVPGNGKVYDITIPGEDLTEGVDDKFFDAIKKPAEEKVEFEVKAAESEEEEEEKDDSTEKADTSKKTTTKPAAKKEAPKPGTKKKTSAKKGKKTEPVNEGDDQHKKDVEKMKQDEDSAKQDEADMMEEAKAVLPAEEEVNDNITEVEFEEPEAEVANVPEPAPEPEPVIIPPIKTKSIEELIAEGQKLHIDREYRKAEAAFKEALEMDPDNKVAKAGATKAEQWAKAVERLPA